MGNHWNVPSIGKDRSGSVPGRDFVTEDRSGRGIASVYWGLVPIVVIIVLVIVLLY